MHRTGDDERDEGGAAAVEFALIFPVLILLFGGIIDFGFAFNAQISLTHAAREGVRIEAITGDTAEARATAVAAFTAPAASLVGPPTVDPTCSVADRADLTIEANYDFFLLSIIPGLQTITLQGQAVMRCGG